MLIVTTLITHSIKSPINNNQAREGNQQNPIGKVKVKLSLFAESMMIYIQDPKQSAEKLLETIRQYNNLASHKVITKNLLHFFI